MSFKKRKKALLALEDGTVFQGYAFGSDKEGVGEVVFNTSMTGYQEIMTDPSYAGQIVTMTYPLIGNYGIVKEDHQSRKPFVRGMIVREVSEIYSNWRAEKSIQEFMQEFDVIGIEGIDTRALTKHIRTKGAMRGYITVDADSEKAAVEKAQSAPSIIGMDLVKEVTIDKPYVWAKKETFKHKVVALDFGIKMNIIRNLVNNDCGVTIVPADTPAHEILDMNPDGIFLSNGPGDPSAVTYAIDTVRELLGKKPIFGICLGHQLLSLALGGKTYKLKFGHRGGNHPVKSLDTGFVDITTQNHGFAVETKSLNIEERPWKVGQTLELGGWRGESEAGPLEITHINLNDGTVEGLRCLDVPAFSVQYHPEAAPGPRDALSAFGQFNKLMTENRN